MSKETESNRIYIIAIKNLFIIIYKYNFFQGSLYNLIDFPTDEDLNTEDDVDECEETKGAFEYLNSFLDNENFTKPIETPVNKNVGEVLMMLIQYSLVNALPLTAIENLFKLINCIFVESIIPETKYFIDKLFNPKNCTTYHALCDNCGQNIGTFTSSDIIKKCALCNFDTNVKDSMYANFFVTLDPSTQISDLIEANCDYYDDVVNYKVSNNQVIGSIYDGKLYQRFVKGLDSSDRNRYVTVIFNTDGAPLFESSTYSIWPIYIMLNELPIEIRTKNLIVVGLWFNKKKPDMNVFLKPFVEKMNSMGDIGVPCKIKNEMRVIKLFCLVCCVDSVARAPMQGLQQFNGKYGCNWCKHPTKWIVNKRKPKSGSSKYPWLDVKGLLRTEEESIRHMHKATAKKPCYGFKNPSILINLKKFNIIDGFVPDEMHLVSGVVKQFATIWFGSKNGTSSLLKKSEIGTVNELLLSTKVPHQVGRLTRSLQDRAHWKAREWQNWLLYYSLPIMCQFLDKKLIEHWTKLVEAIHILLQSEISIIELNRADELLYEFVYDTQRLYSKFAMTFNIHLLLHLARSVLNWGPLYEHSAFAFEAGNAKLLRVVNAAKGVHKQICRHITLNTSYGVLKKRVYPFASEESKSFCSNLSTLVVQKSEKLSTARYFGKSTCITSSLMEKLQLSSVAQSFKKITKDGCLYLSSLKENKRSDNSFVKLKDGKYVKLLSFIVDRRNNVEKTIGQEIMTESIFENKCAMVRKIVSIKKEQLIVNTSEIKTVCVHVKVGKQEYICALPNLCSY